MCHSCVVVLAARSVPLLRLNTVVEEGVASAKAVLDDILPDSARIAKVRDPQSRSAVSVSVAVVCCDFGLHSR